MTRPIPAHWLLPVLALGLGLGGCGTTLPQSGIGGEGDFNRGETLYEQERYSETIPVLDAFRTEHPGSDHVDDAIFLLGMCHLKLGENALARDEFDRLLRDFPQTSHREEALYERALSWFDDARQPTLDPEPTQAALDAFQSYLKSYPDGKYKAEAQDYAHRCLDRLATKAYLNAETYVRLQHPEAAAIYFEKALKILPDFSHAGDALIWLAQDYERRGAESKAREAYQALLDYATPDRLRADEHLRLLREEASEALARLGGAGAGR